MTTPNINTQKRSFFQGRKMWFWTAAGLGIVTLIVLVVFLQGLISTTKYYVLNKDVAARTLVTQDMLTERTTSEGGQPPTALDIAAVANGDVYTKTNLTTGDILTASNAGDLVPLRDGIPTDYVIASFTAPATFSAGGNITRGDYIDVYLANDTTSKLVFQRMLIVDAVSSIENGEGDETVTADDETAVAPYRVGIPTVYTVGISQQDASKLALAVNSGQVFFVTLSSAESVENGATEIDLGTGIDELTTGVTVDSGLGTDNTFKPVKGNSTEVPTTGSSDNSDEDANSETDTSSEPVPVDPTEESSDTLE